jgi:hypothetical protein
MDPFPLERIAGALVRAALDRTQWTQALETVATCTNSYGAVLLPVVGNMPFVCATSSLEKSFDHYLQGGCPPMARSLPVPRREDFGTSRFEGSSPQAT